MPKLPIARRTLIAGGLIVGGTAAVAGSAVLWTTDRSDPTGGARESAKPVRYRPKARPRALPIVFERARTCGHNAEALMPYDRQVSDVHADAYNRNGEAWSILGARTMLRPVKNLDEDPWWPSSAPSDLSTYYAGARTNIVHLASSNRRTDRHHAARTVPVHLAAGENFVSGWLSEANDHDVLMVVYYRYYNEYTLANGGHGEPANPSWVVKHQDGSVWHSSTGTWLDITTPAYRDIVAARLVELAGYGVQAFYFDYLGLPNAEGPRGTATEAAYSNQTGSPPPRAAPFKSTTPGAVRWRQFCADRLADTFGVINSQLKASHPEAVFIASCTYLPALTLPFHTTRMLAVIDCAKTEWGLAYAPDLQDNVFGALTNPDLPRPNRETQRAMGWTLLRDGANGRPFHCWVKGTATAEQAAAAAAGIIAYGGIASMNGTADTLSGVLTAVDSPVLEATPRAGLEASFELSEVAGPYLANASPLRHVAVFYSEECRDRIAGGDARVAWQKVLWPMLGGFEGFLRARVPVGVVNDSQLTVDGLQGYQVLYVWDRSAVTQNQATVINQFENSGGTVIEAPAGGQWATLEGNGHAGNAMYAVAAGYRATSPVSVTGSPGGMRAIAYSQRPGEGVVRLVIAIVNDFSHVQLTGVGRHGIGDNRAPNPAPGSVSAIVHWKQSIQMDGTTYREPSAAYFVLDRSPIRTRLTYAVGPNDQYSATLPRFQHLALVVIEW